MTNDQPRVQVVWYELDAPAEVVDTLAATLDEAARRRVDRLADPTQVRRATVRFARRREILASLGVGHDADPASPLWSSSSRNGLGLLAISSGPRVGVDVEAAAEIHDAERLASAIATDEEGAALHEAAPSQRQDLVLRLWTRKEAYLKATGEGVGAGVRHVRVPLDLNAWGLSFQPDAPYGPTWRLYDLDCPYEGCAAALVVEVAPTMPQAPLVTITSWRA